MNYLPDEQESEKASYSYLMSLIAGITGTILPLVNLVASCYFYAVNKRSSYFVRWHCVQALISQLTLLLVNSIAFYWTMKLIFGNEILSNSYFAFIISTGFVNIIEMIATIYAAIQLRKGIDVRFPVFGDMVDLIINEKTKRNDKQTF